MRRGRGVSAEVDARQDADGPGDDQDSEDDDERPENGVRASPGPPSSGSARTLKLQRGTADLKMLMTIQAVGTITAANARRVATFCRYPRNDPTPAARRAARPPVRRALMSGRRRPWPPRSRPPRWRPGPCPTSASVLIGAEPVPSVWAESSWVTMVAAIVVMVP